MRAFSAIVKLTFRHAVRSHIFQLLFGVLLLCVALIPTTITNSTAADFLKSSIFYSLWIVSAVLGLSSIWLGCFIMTCDIDSYQLHMVVSKPVSRITVWLGKWTGVCLVNLLLLAAASTAVYFIILYRFNNLEFPPGEKERMRAEVLVGRRAFRADRPDYSEAINELVRQKIKRLTSQGRTVDTQMQEKLIKDSQLEVVSRDSEAKVGVVKSWRFSNIPANTGKPIFLRYRPYINKVASEDQRPAHLLWSVGIPRERKAAAQAGPLAQQNAKTYDIYLYPLDDKPDQVMTGVFHEKELKPEWNVVSSDGYVFMTVVNLDRLGGTMFFQPADGPKLLVPATGFAGNYARAVLVIGMELMLLAALSCAFAGCLSMPVAIFMVLSYLLFGAFSVYMVNLEYLAGFADRFGQFVGKVLLWVVIPLQRFDVSSVVSDGVLVEWAFIGSLFFHMIVLKALPLVLLGIYFYNKRELGLIVRK
ncbi:MAG: hypothetical protein J6S54_05470 [Lentisphaeria bacterium]|nr:hypothetical protein [Lentisphaeria bacterium]